MFRNWSKGKNTSASAKNYWFYLKNSVFGTDDSCTIIKLHHWTLLQQISGWLLPMFILCNRLKRIFRFIFFIIQIEIINFFWGRIIFMENKYLHMMLIISSDNFCMSCDWFKWIFPALGFFVRITAWMYVKWKWNAKVSRKIFENI